MSITKSIKFRLTVWYVAAIAFLLAVFGAVASYQLSTNLYRNLDDSLRARVGEIEGSIKVQDRLVPGQAPQIQFEQKFNELVMLYNADGALLQRLGPNVKFSNIEDPIKNALFGQSSYLSATTTEGQEVRLYFSPFNVDSRTRIAIVVGRLPSDIESLLSIFRQVIVYSALLAVILAGAGGMFLAGRALGPVGHMADVAREIGESDLSRRIEVQGDDELGHLASTLNGMIARLEEAFGKQRQFVADASHELRTPLAIIQAESSLALDKRRTQAEYRKSLEVVAQEVAYMTEIVGKLLLLARSDSGAEPVQFQEINVADLFTKLAQDVEVLAQEKGLRFSLGPMESLTVKGDRLKLRQLFLNILDNAVRYTPAGGAVTGSVTRRNGSAVVTIEDTGAGIAPEHLPFIFDRFYRVDKARSRADGGTGLGLAIAMSIAKMHDGTIEVESQVDKGTLVRVVLPAVPPAQT
jgi:two-component system, OmpR family, sensor histidine kinase ArlS